jgi:hypothetical protein
MVPEPTPAGQSLGVSVRIVACCGSLATDRSSQFADAQAQGARAFEPDYRFEFVRERY